MPSNQPAKSTKAAAKVPAARRQPQSPFAASTKKPAETAERDETYALISVLYHTLQGADTIGSYIEDARRANDEELAMFFEETKGAYAERASEAKELLATRLKSSDDDDDEDEESEDDAKEDADED
jgi:hypothetical protein